MGVQGEMLMCKGGRLLGCKGGHWGCWGAKGEAAFQGGGLLGCEV